MVRKNPPARSYSRPIERALDSLRQGATFADALAALGRGFLPSFDLALIQAGENSGRLDHCFRLLAEYYRERARLARQILADLIYPAVVLHAAVLLMPPALLTRLILQGDLGGYLWAKAAILGPLYAAVLVALYLAQDRRGEGWRRWLEQALRRVPVLGTARAELALARLSIALESLLNAGVSVVEAWDLAAAASGSPRLRRTVAAWRAAVLAGQTPAEAVRESRVFPDLFTNLYATGEVSGQLDDTLRRLHHHYQEEATRKMHLVAQWTPRLIYFLVIILVAYQVLSFYAGYFSQIDELTR
jgi:type II secretory pathway component PulF